MIIHIIPLFDLTLPLNPLFQIFIREEKISFLVHWQFFFMYVFMQITIP